MKRSEINSTIRAAAEAFARHGWALPPNPRWDVTDFGLGDFPRSGLVLVNLCEQAEYCEKLMLARREQQIPMHFHRLKKEDIICRWGRLVVALGGDASSVFHLQVNGEVRELCAARPVILAAGERITLPPGTPHAFWSESEYTIVGEVSTANDDQHDNYFLNSLVGRFSRIDEDEPATAPLVSD